MPKINEPELWDGTRMAKILGISPRRMRQLAEDGVVHPKLVKIGNREVRRYEPVSTIRLYYEFLLCSKKAPLPEEATESMQRYESARADLYEARAKAAKFENDVMSGRLVYAKDVEQDLKTFFISFKAFALNLPKRLAGRFTGLVKPEVLRKVEKEMREETVEKLRDFAACPEGDSDEPA